MGGHSVTFFIIFTLGYLLGGFTALFLLGLTVAARRGSTPSAPLMRAEETVAAQQREG
jgi:hypothetical protein